MLPVVAGPRETRRQVLAYTLLLAILSVLPALLGYAGPLYGVVAAVLGGMFVVHAVRVIRDRTDPLGVSLTQDAPAKAAFQFSIGYLFVLFGALAVDHFVR
jgi:protoheme IX farnesyltransferase